MPDACAASRLTVTLLRPLAVLGPRPQAAILGRFAARKKRPRFRLRAKRRIECFPRLQLFLFVLLRLLVLLVVLLAVVAFAHDGFLFARVGWFKKAL
jgi:hypothetical protein